jgi:hypothetical protein
MNKTKSKSERRLVENEVFFRQANQAVEDGLKDVAKLARDEGHMSMAPDDDAAIQFYCECSDEKCTKRITLSAAEYEEAHKNQDQFMILPGHNLPELERIIKSTGKYLIIEKFMSAPLHVDKLNATNLDLSNNS